MDAVLVPYLLAWAATSAYIAWLAVQNARLAARQKELQKTWEERDRADRRSQAA